MSDLVDVLVNAGLASFSGLVKFSSDAYMSVSEIDQSLSPRSCDSTCREFLLIPYRRLVLMSSIASFSVRSCRMRHKSWSIKDTCNFKAETMWTKCLIITPNRTCLQGYFFHIQTIYNLRAFNLFFCLQIWTPLHRGIKEICVKNVSLPTQIYNNTVPLPHFFLKLNVRSLKWSTNLALNLPILFSNDKLIRLPCCRASLDFLCREVLSFPFMPTHAHTDLGIYVVHIYLFFVR